MFNLHTNQHLKKKTASYQTSLIKIVKPYNLALFTILAFRS